MIKCHFLFLFILFFLQKPIEMHWGCRANPAQSSEAAPKLNVILSLIITVFLPSDRLDVYGHLAFFKGRLLLHFIVKTGEFFFYTKTRQHRASKRAAEKGQNVCIIFEKGGAQVLFPPDWPNLTVIDVYLWQPSSQSAKSNRKSSEGGFAGCFFFFLFFPPRLPPL